MFDMAMSRAMLDDAPAVECDGNRVTFAGRCYELGAHDIVTGLVALRYIGPAEATTIEPGPEPTEPPVGMCLASVIPGFGVQIIRADERIDVVPEFIEMIEDGHIRGASYDMLSDTITLEGVNRTVRYKLAPRISIHEGTIAATLVES